MAVSRGKILSNEEILEIINNPIVLIKKQEIEKKGEGSIYFTIELSEIVKGKLKESLSFDLFGIDEIPMRWIKGDTKEHIDKTRNNSGFEATYLVYLTSSEGSLRIGEESYPIGEGLGYVFNEGEKHETINTGSEPRLLLGPMNERGERVGLPPFTLEGPGGSTIYLQQVSGDIQYSTDQLNWTTVGNLPLLVVNNNTGLGILTLEFSTDITFADSVGYFIIGSDNIQIGSNSLPETGVRRTITIDGISGYLGLISNSINSPIEPPYGYNNIYVYNLNIVATNGSLLTEGGGWIGQQEYGKSGTNNYIINCNSNGPINADVINLYGCGGIVGAFAGSSHDSDYPGELTIIGCSSSGEIGILSGGICGGYTADFYGDVIIKSCWSTGGISANGGGICGDSSGYNGSITIENCYSEGNISSLAGGICGSFPFSITIANCYSRGNIDGYAGGGIIGSMNIEILQTITISNCYSTGNINSDGGGIIGYTTYFIGTCTISNCFVCGGLGGVLGQIVADSSVINGSVSDYVTLSNNNYNNGWTKIKANEALTDIPITGQIGTIWVENTINQPYELLNMGFNPYNLTNISETPDLIQTMSFELSAGEFTSQAFIPLSTYSIIGFIDGPITSFLTITIDEINGIISTTTETEDGIYVLVVRNTGSYSYTQVTLTVNSSDPLPCLLKDTRVLTPNGYELVQNLNIGDKVVTSDNRISEIIKIKKTNCIGSIKTYPCLIPKNSIGNNYPNEDLIISQNHLIKYYNSWIIPKEYFRLDRTFTKINYYHLELENYLKDHLVINDGIVVESLGITDDKKNKLKYRKENLRRKGMRPKFIAKLTNGQK